MPLVNYPVPGPTHGREEAAGHSHIRLARLGFTVPRAEPDAGQLANALEARQKSETKVRQFVADVSHQLLNWRPELPDEPVLVNGDASQLRKVLMNLLSNARKHTPAGTTVVTGVGTSRESAAVVTVTDDGGGIPEEFVYHVFSQFARADAARMGAGGQKVLRRKVPAPGLVHCAIHRGSARRPANGDITAGPPQFALQLPSLARANKATRRRRDSRYLNVT